ncbi:sigma-70 family RNA polymerase sigma factor [Solirubrobacter phytolaccae]|uniref:Sigma-70 family RNA polymerase sigma factor n=1 Tax=Solirubrobacter phytolaccae TaxID=1404360 RepID=A0A9X3NEJ8_9ACTN|nr:sigma-70 family RNA polymerase sigma factor [Solirubrobacter phytolaccae]MDA0185275.1 sigma-70 family RNA polymerase sigma factor [Solirubrobacter phytolaccae]
MIAERSPGVLESLVAAAARGDEHAWAMLVERFGPRLLRVARAHGLSPHEAEDAVQETWVRLLRNIERVREPNALGGWLATTARHESLRVRERSAREKPTGDELTLDHADGTGSEAETQLDTLTCRAAVTRALDGLPPRHRALLRALFAESEPSYREIATQLDMPIGSIGPIRQRCLAQLRRHGSLRRLADAA